MSTWPTTTAAVADALIAGPGQNPAVGSLLPRTGGIYTAYRYRWHWCYPIGCLFFCPAALAALTDSRWEIVDAIVLQSTVEQASNVDAISILR